MGKSPPKRKPPGAGGGKAKGGFEYWPHVLLAAIAFCAAAYPGLQDALWPAEQPAAAAPGRRSSGGLAAAAAQPPAVAEGTCEADASELCAPWQKAGYCLRGPAAGPSAADVLKKPIVQVVPWRGGVVQGSKALRP